MDSNYREYKYLDSFARIDEILKQPSTNYEERKALPDRDALTYSNGFYAYCSAMFVDVRDSSKLPDAYNRPALAKLYRAFISEMVSLMNGFKKAREINIVGDCVWGVFNTDLKPDIDEVFSMAAQANTLMKVLNYKLAKASYTVPLRSGIGISYGRALMIQAGANGSGISDVVYMGDVVNKASKLAAAAGGAQVEAPIVLDGVFRQNLKEHNVNLTHYNSTLGNYTADVISPPMNDWFMANCT